MPKLGSLQEWVCLATLERLEDIEYAKFRASSQLVIDKSEGMKAFNEYMELAFPTFATKQRERQKLMLEALRQSVAKGPLHIQEVEKPRVESRIRTVLKE